ncbi:hypothetical protein PMZ80_009656 [Knufia obscura]|uniref:Uncharacterized protein n=1 Tax=Knufia obscura TaxID=1635080 RepID=A0ABR0RBT1_9EURO|nr:hypothetical protein PMZ80_009656 [Knufia obscura]
MSSYTATAIVPTSVTQSLQSYSPLSRSTSQRPAQNASSTAAQPVVPSPGRFRHPRMNEVAKRRAASSFTSRNVQTIGLNVFALLMIWLSSGYTYPAYVQPSDSDNVAAQLLTGPRLNTIIRQTNLDKLALSASQIFLLVRFILLSNIYFALRPILPYVSKPDTIEDIPLTPSQRALMGLPRSKSNTPTSPAGEGSANYITPPRYRRSSASPFAGTPQSSGTGNRSTSANYSASPMSTSRFAQGFSPTPQQSSTSRRQSGSPFSPSSPLFNKRFFSPPARNDVLPNADFTESTRSLFDGTTSTSSFQSSLRRSQSMRERGRPPQVKETGTPSPSAREKNKVNIQPGLNYKWLYEKGMKVGKNGGIEY